MPTDGEPNSQPKTEPDDSDSPSSEPPSGEANTPPPEDDSDLPVWAQGKSKRWLADNMNRLMETVAQGQQPDQGRQQATQQASFAQNMPQNQPQTAAGMPDPDLQVTDPQRWQQELSQWQRSQMQQFAQQALGPLYQQVGQMAKQASMNDPERKDVWDQYAPEIVQMMNDQGVPPESRTKDAWDMAADIIAGRHRKELAQKEAERLAAGGGAASEPSPQAGPDATPDYRDAVDRFWAEGGSAVDSFRRDGITKSDVRKAARAMGLDPERYIELKTNGLAIEESDRIYREVS